MLRRPIESHGNFEHKVFTNDEATGDSNACFGLDDSGDRDDPDFSAGTSSNL